MAVFKNVLVDADTVEKAIARVEEKGGSANEMSWDMQMGLGLSHDEQRKALVEFKDDNIIVVHLQDDKGVKMRSVTLKDNRITHVDDERRQREFEYTKGGASPHASSHWQ